MFIPNTTATLYRMTGHNAFGRPIYTPGETIAIGVVDLGDTVIPSAVRADQSASRGSADIDTVQATLLLPKTVVVKDGDAILIDGFHVMVNGIQPRRNVLGKLDHYEVVGALRAGPL